MLALVTKANSDYWYEFRNVETLDDLMRIYPVVIVQKNEYKNDKEIFDFWDGFKQEDKKLMKEANYHVIIYNGYIE